MSDLIERLRREQARLQRVIDTKKETVKRKRTLVQRLKMTTQCADEIERLTESNTILEYRLADSHRNVDRLTARIKVLEVEINRLKDGVFRIEDLVDSVANPAIAAYMENPMADRNPLADGMPPFVKSTAKVNDDGSH